MHEPSPRALPTAAPASATAAAQHRRRRLWELPTRAHELLLALSFSPEVLRREAARTLGQEHRGICQLKGSDVDVLYSLMHDMCSRNALSEALHKKLDERHARMLLRTRGLREPEALRAVWQEALNGTEAPACLWAVMTHPLGAELQDRVLCEARGWVFAHVRRSVAQVQLQTQVADEMVRLRQQLDTLRTRLSQRQQQGAVDLAQARAELAQLRGELARRAPGEPAPALPKSNPQQVRRVAAGPASAAPVHAADSRPTGSATQAPPAPPAQQAITVHGRRVLCVGGIQHAVSRYRSRIEGLGGHFDHHDGGLEDSVQALDSRLNRAELVFCQAACINHEAYYRVKRHCARTGTPCVFLERPSLSRFDRALKDIGTTATASGA